MTQYERRQNARRIQFENEVEIDFPDFGEFIKEYSANISAGGMFIKTALPFEPDHEFGFRFVAGDNVPVISGRAVVVWKRDREVSPMAVAGMGVRFLELDSASKALIEKIVAYSEHQGNETPFVLTDIPQVKF